jgi:hypothetical protein
MQSDLDTLARVQALDLQAVALRKEIAELPKHIAVIERQLEAHTRRLEADKALLAANQKDRRQCEGEVQLQQQKISKLRDQMMSAKTNEQYRAFQHEIEFCENAIKVQEDKIIELMEHVEVLEKNVRTAEAALASERQQVEAQKNEARKRTAEDQAQLKAALEQRQQLLGSVPANLASAYERATKRFNGFAIAEVTSDRCTACNLEIRPQYLQDLRKREKLMLCENCSRILHYNPPIAIDEHGPSDPAPPPRPASPKASVKSPAARAVSTHVPAGTGTRVDMS